MDNKTISSKVIPANAIAFQEICLLFDRLFKKKSNKKEQERILIKFCNDFIESTASITEQKDASFYPVLRLILPRLEKRSYNLKESKLGALLVKVLSLPKGSDDAKKLVNYAYHTGASKAYDFAGVAFRVLKTLVNPPSSSLTVGEINDILDNLAKSEAKGQDIFSNLIKKINAEQITWLLRIILKDLKLGVETKRILTAYHPDAPEVYKACNDLSKVCQELENGNASKSVRLFFAMCPMLSERLDIRNVGELPQNKSYLFEEKFDGERFQLHMDNGKFEYFSRNGHAYGEHYGTTPAAGLLAPFLKDCFAANVTSCIMDGEMMGWHKQRQCFGSKGMAFDVKKITDRSKFRPCFCAFDLLFYNGKPLAGSRELGGLPLKKRLELLDNIFTDVPGVIIHSKSQIISKSSDIVDALNKVIEEGKEGIIVKDVDSYYEACSRTGGWYKIKPEYNEDTMSDLDLVVIGADEAENKAHGRAKCFLVACADSVSPDARPHRWLCVGRVLTGLTFEEREQLCSELEKHWVPSSRTPPPAHLVFNKEKPDYWILPEHSVVLEIRASEMIRSVSYGTSHTLRFPRVVRVRRDKPVRDALRLADFDRLVSDKGSVVKLSTKTVNLSELDAPKPKKARTRTTVAPRVAQQFTTTSGADVPVTSQALLGLKVCVLSRDEDCSKAELEKIVVSHGGKVVANYGPDTWCCVAGGVPSYSATVAVRARADVARSAWLRALAPRARPLRSPPAPIHLLSTSDVTRLKHARYYDRFGDSYTEPVNEATLKMCLQRMEAEEPKTFLTTAEMLQFDNELYGDERPFSFLRGCFLHTTGCHYLTVLRANMYGATDCDIASPALTHVVVPKNTEPQMAFENREKVYVVSEEWLEECVARTELVSETTFLVARNEDIECTE